MNTDRSAARGTRPSSGAHFHCCALQVNPHAYGKQFRGIQPGGDEDSYALGMIEKALEIGVSVIAVTNHNDAKGVKAFRRAATGKNITIFPGFEISSSEGIHILCIYPPATEEETLGRFLGELGIRETTASSNLASHPFGGVLAKVQQQGGIGIAAHVNSNKGLFTVLSGQARIDAWRKVELCAIQIPGPVSNLPEGISRIIRNEDPKYQRSHPAGKNLAVAVVNAKDVSKPSELSDSSATCWIKMSEVTIEGLRQAFLDPESRIRLQTDPVPEDHAEILSLTWDSGFLAGTKIHFNPNLNVLVGGRGAGKSTVIESLRYALDLEPIGEDSQKAHAGIVRQVLRPATKLSLQLRSLRPSRREYLIERIVPNPPVVRDETGQISNLLPKDILPRVEIFGQHEISELTKSPEKRTLLLNRFIDRDETLDRRKTSVHRNLAQTRRTITEIRSELQQIDNQLATLPALEETLVRYQDAGLEERLKQRSLLVREERILDSIPERLKVFHDAMDSVKQELPLDLVFLSLRALEDLPGGAILAEAEPKLKSLNADLERVASLLEDALSRAEKDIEKIRGRWEERKQEVEVEYRKILRDLKKSAVDGEEFIRLRGEIEGLRPLQEHGILLKRQEEELANQRLALLAEWEEIKATEFRLLDKAARNVSQQLHNRVKVEVTASGEREPFFAALKSEIGGRLSEAIEHLRKSQDLSLPQFVKCCREGAESLHRTYTVPMAQAQRLVNASPESLMKIEELELPPTTEILLSTAPSGEPPSWQTLDRLSTGQKATAVLLLLLLDSEAPLIIDQPEDDLDNRFITEGVVPSMRDAKRRRQFIFTTHNANIPVLGDAELILGLTASGEAEQGYAEIKADHMGSIDSQQVRELVEEILEGGKEAFETRRLKYGF